MAPLQTKGAKIYIWIAAAKLKNLPRDKTRSLKSALVSAGAAQLSKVEIWWYIIAAAMISTEPLVMYVGAEFESVGLLNAYKNITVVGMLTN